MIVFTAFGVGVCPTVNKDIVTRYCYFVTHLESNELIQDSQHGFRKGRSRLTNLLVFLDKVTGYIDEG